MIKGKLINLTSIEQEDLEQLRTWRNLPEYRKYFREYREINKDMQLKWYQSKVLDDSSTMMFAVRDKFTNDLLGCCGLCYINWIDRNADLSLYIGWNESYIDNVGYAYEACQLLFQFGFHEMGLHKIWTEIYEFDQLKYQLYKKLGFHQDGLLRDQCFHDGRWWNSHILSLLNCEILNRGTE